MFELPDKATILILLALSVIGLNIVGYYILPEKMVTTFFQLVFICIPFIINFSLILFGYKKDMFQINEIIYPTLFLILIWFTSFSYYKTIYEVPNILNIITGILSIIAIIIFETLYNKQEKDVIDVKNMSINGLYPILQQHQKFFSSSKNFIVFFQSLRKISEFTIKKNDIKVTFYPVFRSPHLINQYSLIFYVQEEDISDLNLRYLTVTSYKNKIEDFKNIIKFLIEHFQKNSKIQEENVNKLFLFISSLENKKTSSFKIFETVSYLNFICENNHLIPEILQFWEILNLNNIPNCQKQIDLNDKKIKILRSIIRIYPSLINSFHLKKDKNELQKTLYLFFINYNNLKKNDSLDLKSLNILPIFYKCAFNEPNLNLDTFTSEIITILKKNK